MKKIVVLILALAAVLSLTAGDYHNPGMKFWASGTYTVTVECRSPINVIYITTFDQPVKVVLHPDLDSTVRPALGDTLTLPVDFSQPIPLPTQGVYGFRIIRDGGATTMLATWE